MILRGSLHASSQVAMPVVVSGSDSGDPPAAVTAVGHACSRYLLTVIQSGCIHRRPGPLQANLSARSARASYPALCEAVDQERRDGNNDHGADYRADDPAPVELVCVADA